MRSIALVVLLIASILLAEAAPLKHANSPKAIPGSYIVILKDVLSVAQRDAHIQNLRAAENVEIGFVYTKAVNGFSARLSPEMLKAELAHPDVEYIEVDQVMSIFDEPQQAVRAPLDTITQTGATWGINRISQHILNLDGNYVYDASAGSGVDVFVLDTGILITHDDFGGRAEFAFTAFPAETTYDGNGHGTHCAGTIGGTIYGVAKQVNLKAVKVLNAGGSGTAATVIAGIDFVTQNFTDSHGVRPAVASMSLGGGASDTLDKAVATSIAAGIPYAIAAGNNNGDACFNSPARVPTAVTVGATTNTDARASYSNWGTCLDIFAPGSSITSDWIGSNTATNTISGTSMATPHVAGAIAIRLSLVKSTPADITAWLNAVATNDTVTNPGTNSPNVFLFSPSA